jgi:hypothetical protein
MFRTKTLDHEGAIEWARRGPTKVAERIVGDAFLASLTARRPDLRSALASYHLARVLPLHRPHTRPGRFGCDVCGNLSREETEYDLNVLNFERLKWGGVRLTDPVYIGFDLDRAATWTDVEPVPQDLGLMRDLLDSIRRLGKSDPHARPQQLEKTIALRLGGNRYQRRVVLEILAICGVLQPRGRPNFARGWVPYVDRPEPPEHKNDWLYPMHAWRGADGVDDARVAELFPQLAG